MNGNYVFQQRSIAIRQEDAQQAIIYEVILLVRTSFGKLGCIVLKRKYQT